MSLSENLKASTWALHKDAEQCTMIQQLFRGQLGECDYLKYLKALHAVYQALDTSLASRKKDERIGAFAEDALYRTEALREDITFFEKRLSLAPQNNDARKEAASLDYSMRIIALNDNHPLLLIAHAYVRYLGDLSGGQILKGIISKSYNLKGSNGTAFYQFEKIENAKAFKVEFRQKLDALVLSSDEEAQMLNEAQGAFKLNIGMFEQLSS